VIHKRHFQFNKSEIVISDLIKEGKRESYSYLHFHPDVHVVSTQDEIILNDEYRINFKGFDSQHIESYDYATEFNKLAHSNKWVGCFGRQSTITIERIRSV
jgi:Ca2+-binding EF-hand superfamily protein